MESEPKQEKIETYPTKDEETKKKIVYAQDPCPGIYKKDARYCLCKVFSEIIRLKNPNLQSWDLHDRCTKIIHKKCPDLIQFKAVGGSFENREIELEEILSRKDGKQKTKVEDVKPTKWNGTGDPL